jgi:hypothetical protein
VGEQGRKGGKRKDETRVGKKRVNVDKEREKDLVIFCPNFLSLSFSANLSHFICSKLTQFVFPYLRFNIPPLFRNKNCLALNILFLIRSLQFLPSILFSRRGSRKEIMFRRATVQLHRLCQNKTRNQQLFNAVVAETKHPIPCLLFNQFSPQARYLADVRANAQSTNAPANLGALAGDESEDEDYDGDENITTFCDHRREIKYVLVHAIGLEMGPQNKG